MKDASYPVVANHIAEIQRGTDRRKAGRETRRSVPPAQIPNYAHIVQRVNVGPDKFSFNGGLRPYPIRIASRVRRVIASVRH